MQSSCSIKMSSHQKTKTKPKPSMHVFNHFPPKENGGWFCGVISLEWNRGWVVLPSLMCDLLFSQVCLILRIFLEGEVEYCTWDARVERSRALYEAVDQGQLLTSHKKKIIFSQRHFHGFDHQDNTIRWMECVLSRWKCSFKRNANISFIFVLVFVLLYLGSLF